MEHTTTEDIGISESATHKLAGYSAMAGICPLIPVPFLDDFIIERVHRRLLQKLTAQHDAYLSVDDAKFMTDKQSNLLTGAAKGLLLWPIKKLIRKVIYVLAIKSCADVATAVFHEGWLFARALEQGYVDPAALGRGDRDVLKRLRTAIREAVDEVDPDTTQQLMRSAFGVGREVFDSISDSLKGVFGGDEDDGENAEEKIDEAEEKMGPLTERIEHELKAHWSLTGQLDAALQKGLETDEGTE